MNDLNQAIPRGGGVRPGLWMPRQPRRSQEELSRMALPEVGEVGIPLTFPSGRSLSTIGRAFSAQKRNHETRGPRKRDCGRSHGLQPVENRCLNKTGLQARKDTGVPRQPRRSRAELSRMAAVDRFTFPLGSSSAPYSLHPIPYTLPFPASTSARCARRRACRVAEYCAPASSSSPVRKAQIISPTETSNGPYTECRSRCGSTRM